MQAATEIKNTCHYCGDPCLDDKVNINNTIYCCYGCATLDDVVGKISVKTEDVSIKYKQFDLPETFDKLVDFQNEKIYRLGIDLPAIHCSSCVELLEDLPSFSENVMLCSVNFEQRRCNIVVKKELALSSLAQLLEDIGYPPQLSLGNKLKQEDKRRQRTALFKMVLAGFCFGNIMLYAMPHYFGLSIAVNPFFSRLFVSLSIILSIPVLFYSGMEYLSSAYKALMASRIHINVPIALGLLTLWGRSLYEIFSGTGPGYLDSLAGLVFFLLVGKWYQSKIYDQVSFQRTVSEFIPMVVRKLTERGFEWSPIGELDSGDTILVKHQEIIPVEGVLLSNHALLDYSFITGEQLPEEIVKGNKVYAGGKQLGGNIEIKLDKTPDVNTLWSNWTHNSQKEYPVSWTNHISKHFTISVLAIAFGAAAIWYFIDPSMVPFVFSSVLIVACPCALALSAPFTYGGIVRVFSSNNFFVKDPESIQTLGQLKHLALDKTGTITETSEGEVRYVGEELSSTQLDAIAALAAQSTHPLSQQINRYLNRAHTDIDHFEEFVGMGVSGEYKGTRIKLGSASWLEAIGKKGRTQVFVKVNDQVLGSFDVKTKYRNGVQHTLSDLSKHYKLSVLSGDNESEREVLEAMVPRVNSLNFNLSPIEKETFVSQWKAKDKTGMIGDGLNDGKALHSSDFGIALTESLNGFYPGSDAVLLADSFDRLPRFMELSRYAPTILKAGLVFSLMYNIIGVGFAVTGLLTPIVAAILMPVSSVTVVSLNTLLVKLKAKKLEIS